MKESERGFMQSLLRERDGRIRALERECHALRAGLKILADPESYSGDDRAIIVPVSTVAQNILNHAEAIANPDAPTETKP